MRVVVATLVLVAVTGVAEAYPQFQLSKDQTCSGCHISPAGGGLLLEQGLNTAELISQYGTKPDFMYGAVPTPSWLTLGGDFRGAYGYYKTPVQYLLGFPMQADLYASAVWEGFRAVVTVGARPSTYVLSADPKNVAGDAKYYPPWSREHYVMWQSKPGESEGLFLRVGRFMPVFGLRQAEHVDYNRRFGGTQLYAETYGAAAEYVTQKYEGHFTAFLRDPLVDPSGQSSGFAGYGELRIDDKTSIGAEAMVAGSKDDRKLRGGVTAKRFFPNPGLLLQGELQIVDEMIPGGNENFTTTYTYQLVSYLMASYFPIDAVMVDAGFGHYDENLRQLGPRRSSYDLNVHWFTTSHFEAVLMSRYEHVTGSRAGAYVMLMAHYRL